METGKKPKVEQGDLIVRGMELEKLLSKDFWEAIKKEFPTIELEHICFITSEPDGRLMLGYERSKGKTMRDYFVVGGFPTGGGLAKRLGNVIEEMEK